MLAVKLTLTNSTDFSMLLLMVSHLKVFISKELELSKTTSELELSRTSSELELSKATSELELSQTISELELSGIISSSSEEELSSAGMDILSSSSISNTGLELPSSPQPINKTNAKKEEIS